MKKVLFVRDFKELTGGHLKVWHYYNHFKQIPGYNPVIYFTRDSVFNSINPWINEKIFFLDELNSTNLDFDLIFLDGLDWELVPRSLLDKLPVINLIQHVQHAFKDNKRFKYLKQRAVRICVGTEVEKAIKSTGIVNGPIFTIPNGIDIEYLKRIKKPIKKRDIDLLIIGMKNWSMSKKFYYIIKSLKKFISFYSSTFKLKNIVLLNLFIRREELLKYMARSQITVYFPQKYEGFYLPALEGLILGTIVICPDCIGNREFCVDKVNCFMPRYRLTDITISLMKLLKLNPTQLETIKQNAISIAKKHSLEMEKEKLKEILFQIRSKL